MGRRVVGMDDETLHDLWEAMADLYLDTETRHQIPALALRCVRASLSPREARAIWRYQVSPVVALNLWDVAGEWALWPREWLIPRVEAERRRGCTGVCGDVLYFVAAWPIDPMWRAVERCMVRLAALDAASAATLERDLTWLARVVFDFVPGERPADRSADDLRRCFAGDFLPIYGACLAGTGAAGRLAKALGVGSDREAGGARR